MVDWLKRLVVGQGNVIRERAYTNWNTFDVDAIIAEKEREVGSAGSGDSRTGSVFTGAVRENVEKKSHHG